MKKRILSIPPKSHPSRGTTKIGILALQGSFAEHAKILERIGMEFVFVRDAESLESITHLIIPGGESTTMENLLKTFGMWTLLAQRTKQRKIKILGTCAGAILIAKLFPDCGFIVQRNAYGSQQSSFVDNLELTVFENLEGVFIRAPKLILNNNFDQEKVLASYEGTPVLIEGGGFIAMSFHPELSDETRIHRYFLRKD